MDLTWIQQTGVNSTQNVAPGILKYGKEALADVDKGIVTDALEAATLSIIVAPGMASVCIEDDLDSSLAHAIYNDTLLHKGGHLHGAVVNYGLQVMLTMDGQIEERDKGSTTSPNPSTFRTAWKTSASTPSIPMNS